LEKLFGNKLANPRTWIFWKFTEKKRIGRREQHVQLSINEGDVSGRRFTTEKCRGKRKQPKGSGASKNTFEVEGQKGNPIWPRRVSLGFGKGENCRQEGKGERGKGTNSHLEPASTGELLPAAELKKRI